MNTNKNSELTNIIKSTLRREQKLRAMLLLAGITLGYTGNSIINTHITTNDAIRSTPYITRACTHSLNEMAIPGMTLTLSNNQTINAYQESAHQADENSKHYERITYSARIPNVRTHEIAIKYDFSTDNMMPEARATTTNQDNHSEPTLSITLKKEEQKDCWSLQQ